MIDLHTCIECGDTAILTDGRAIYPHRHDLAQKSFYLCPCGAYVGCHAGTDNPLGRPAGLATRAARMQAHAAFDPLWKRGKMRRSEAYRWLAEKMGRRPAETHISWMSADEARQVVDICMFADV